MTDINKLLNTTSAGLLAQKLDAADGTKDGKIEASIWNEFIKDKGGKEVKQFINVENAMNSLTKYIIRNAKTLGKNVEVLAKEWIKAAPTSSTEATGSVAATATTSTPQTDSVEKPQPPASTTNAEAVEADYKSVKVTVPKKEYPNSTEVKNINKAHKEGKEVAQKINTALKALTPPFGPGDVDKAEETLKLITSDNVAYVLQHYPTLIDQIVGVDAFGYGFDKDEVIKYILKPLGIDGSNMSLEEMKTKAKKAVDKIIGENQNKINKYNQDLKEAKNYNNNIRPQAQKTFDDATKFMAEVANMNPKPEVERGHEDDGNYDWAQTELPDGRWINVYYDNDGKISSILISHDTTPETTSNGTTYDGAEVRFNNGEAYFNYDKSNANWDGIVISGYDFEKLKALAEKIFGKKE